MPLPPPAPLSPADMLTCIIQPSLRTLAPHGIPYSDDAARLLLAIQNQEDPAQRRAQLITVDGVLVPEGPARGLWQFEKAGVRAVLWHTKTGSLAKLLCKDHGIPPYVSNVWAALQTDDIIACCIARLLIRTTPAPLPADEDSAWAQYLDLWRPGKPSRDRWIKAWATALRAVPRSEEPA